MGKQSANAKARMVLGLRFGGKTPEQFDNARDWLSMGGMEIRSNQMPFAAELEELILRYGHQNHAN